MNLGQLLIAIWNLEKNEVLQEHSSRTSLEQETIWLEMELEEFR